MWKLQVYPSQLLEEEQNKPASLAAEQVRD